MKRIKFLSIIIGSILLSCTQPVPPEKAVLTEVTYAVDEAKFPNPERGFYRYTESRPGVSPSMLSENTLKGYRKQNITLIYRVYYLKDFKNKAISQQALNQMAEDMSTLRRAGLKCVLRFAYSDSENEADAPLNIVLRHLEQLRPVFDTNADVIAILQAGFIGAWGEWYYSSNNLKTPAIRATILDKILDVLPSRRMIQLRTPAYKTEYLQNSTALTGSAAFTGFQGGAYRSPQRLFHGKPYRLRNLCRCGKG
jgi:hypothetical protein